MLTDKIESRGHLVIDKHKTNYYKLTRQEKRSTARRAIEPLIDLLVEGIDLTGESLNDFISTNHMHLMVISKWSL
jgi:hypothetical protein